MQFSLLLSCKVSGIEQERIPKELSQRLKQAESIVFCAPADSKKPSLIIYDRLQGKISDKVKVQQLVALIEQGKPVTDYAISGHLAHVVFLDKDGKPLVMASIVLYRSTIVFSNCDKKGNSFMQNLFKPEHLDRLSILQSEAFVREIYNYMKENMASDLKSLQEFHEKVLKERIEEMLFNENYW